MKYSKLVTSLMLSTTILSAASPVLADEVKTKGMSEQSSSVKVNTKMSEKASESSSMNSTTKTDQTKDKSQAEDKTVADDQKDNSTEAQNDPIQTLKEQKMIIKKVIAKGGSKMATVTASSDTSNGDDKSKTLGVSESDLKGVPNSKFVVYDVTDLMNSIIKEKLGVSDEEMQKVTDTDKVDQTGENSKTDSEATESSVKVDTTKEAVVDSAKNSESQKEAKTDSSKKNDALKESKSNNDKDSKNKEETSTDSSEKTEETSEKGPSKAESSADDESDQKSDKELAEKVKELRSGDSLRKEISERAAKLNSDQLKSVAEVTTNDQGTAETQLPIDGKYHAYYVVNTETPKESYATNASPIVVITPVTDKDGMYAPEFTIYPKSDEIPKEENTPQETPKETTATMYQTGHVTFWDKVTKWVSGLLK
ncbi:pilin N-terminal domain-containing protein [Lactobacillus sp. AN1001]